MRRILTVVPVLLAACGPRLISGTDVEDTDDNHRILALVDQYRRATEAKDVEAVSALISDTFFDDGGSPEGSDDLDAKAIRKRLALEFDKRVQQVRLEVQVKKIYLEGDAARVRYFYTLRYQVADGWRQEIDTKEMFLRREGGVWKIMSGV